MSIALNILVEMFFVIVSVDNAILSLILARSRSDAFSLITYRCINKGCLEFSINEYLRLKKDMKSC